MSCCWVGVSPPKQPKGVYLRLEKLAIKQYYDDFLQRLQDCDLVPELEEHLTVQVIHNAVDAFRSRYPDFRHLLRRSGTKEFLMHQFSDAIFAML